MTSSQVPITQHFKRCESPACPRKVSDLAGYCCEPCAHAYEHHYEIHEHSRGCEARAIVRGEWDDVGAV